MCLALCLVISFPKNNRALKRALLHYLLRFANGLFIVDFVVVLVSVSLIIEPFRKNVRNVTIGQSIYIWIFYAVICCKLISFLFQYSMRTKCFAQIHINSTLTDFVSICLFASSYGI